MAVRMDLLHHRSSSLFRHNTVTTRCPRGHPLAWLPIVVCCVARIAVLDVVEGRKALSADNNGDVGLVFRSLQHRSSWVAARIWSEGVCALAPLRVFLNTCVSRGSIVGAVGTYNDFSSGTEQRYYN